jgi:ClpX C4-type zinc finger
MAMFKRNRLACSFCGKSAAEVSKLVAGPKVHICDACVAAAARIMNDAGDGPFEPPPAPGGWRRLGQWLHGFGAKIHGRLNRTPHGESKVSAA